MSEDRAAVADAPFRRPLSSTELRSARRGLALQDAATPAERQAIAAQHDLAALDALAYDARLEPLGESGWRLVGRVRASAAQRCVVTLAPMAAEIDEAFERLWSPDADPGSGAGVAEAVGGRLDVFDEEAGPLSASAWRALSEGEGDAAAEIEPIPDPIDPAAVALETFTLSLDPYPRRDGARFEGAAHGPPGVAALTDETARPFAGLQELKDRLADPAAPREDQNPDDEKA